MFGQLGYAAVTIAIFAETAGVPAPGESSLIAASILAATGRLNIVLVVALAATAAIAGDNLGYLLGRRLGRRVLARCGRWQRHRLALLERGESFFARHGAKAVFIGRWLPVARVTSAWLAGASHMPWRRFALYNALGGLAWAASVGGAAYTLGGSGARVLAVAGAIALVAAFATIVVASRRRRHTSTDASSPSTTTGGAHVPC